MRLLNVHTLEFEVFFDDNVPPYAITSHRWGRTQDEATFQDVAAGQNTQKPGFKKVETFCRTLRNRAIGLEWIWIDTCCIDKTSSSELAEAINSMFRWYSEAELCMVYFHDIQQSHITGIHSQDEKTSDPVSQSEWFRRGWTLQELLAPSTLILYDQNWTPFGCKDGPRTSKRTQDDLKLTWRAHGWLSLNSGIPEAVITDYAGATGLSFEEKSSWMRHRTTSRIEDRAYCLLGIFGVFLPLVYGERENAMSRLYRELENKYGRVAIEGLLDVKDGSDINERVELPRVKAARLSPKSLPPRPHATGVRFAAPPESSPTVQSSIGRYSNSEEPLNRGVEPASMARKGTVQPDYSFDRNAYRREDVLPTHRPRADPRVPKGRDYPDSPIEKRDIPSPTRIPAPDEDYFYERSVFEGPVREYFDERRVNERPRRDDDFGSMLDVSSLEPVDGYNSDDSHKYIRRGRTAKSYDSHHNRNLAQAAITTAAAVELWRRARKEPRTPPKERYYEQKTSNRHPIDRTRYFGYGNYQFQGGGYTADDTARRRAMDSSKHIAAGNDSHLALFGLDGDSSYRSRETQSRLDVEASSALQKAMKFIRRKKTED